MRIIAAHRVNYGARRDACRDMAWLPGGDPPLEAAPPPTQPLRSPPFYIPYWTRRRPSPLYPPMDNAGPSPRGS